MAKKTLFYLLIFIFPWSFRRFLLEKMFKYQIDKKAYISRYALIIPQYLKMEENSSISAFTVAIHIENLVLGKNSLISRSNWISGFPKKSKQHFEHIKDRDPSLILGDESAITKHHIMDCTDKITIGKFSTIAGYRSQFLTHSIDYVESKQSCAPITIGDYCIVGTNSIFLPNSVLPSFSICGAKSVVNKKFDEEYCLYAGTPGKKVKELNKDSKYFNRKMGYVN